MVGLDKSSFVWFLFDIAVTAVKWADEEWKGCSVIEQLALSQLPTYMFLNYEVLIKII